mmetsp:Transcript_39042/g.59468  ORF Transcript_39042/g.59468 Transcript_39042/m.59468 type:complete len:168 (-) Transcript_39042:732-1235(-)
MNTYLGTPQRNHDLSETENMNFSQIQGGEGEPCIYSLKETVRRMTQSSEKKSCKYKGDRIIGDSFLSPQKKEIGPSDFMAHQLLGKGSFGEVFLVEELATQELWAMKVLSKAKVHSQNLLKYAFAELNIMKELTRLDVPYIVKVKYAFQTEESLYIIMQYCSGGDLS